MATLKSVQNIVLAALAIDGITLSLAASTTLNNQLANDFARNLMAKESVNERLIGDTVYYRCGMVELCLPKEVISFSNGKTRGRSLFAFTYISSLDTKIDTSAKEGMTGIDFATMSMETIADIIKAKQTELNTLKAERAEANTDFTGSKNLAKIVLSYCTSNSKYKNDNTVVEALNAFLQVQDDEGFEMIDSKGVITYEDIGVNQANNLPDGVTHITPIDEYVNTATPVDEDNGVTHITPIDEYENTATPVDEDTGIRL